MKEVKILAMSALVSVLASCSVKEERVSCPCWLEIDVSSCSRHDEVVYLKGWSSNSPVLGDKIYLSDCPDIFVKKVPKGTVSYRAYMGVKTSKVSGNRIIIPEGYESDMIYAYSADISADSESAYDRITPHKQFSTVSLEISGSFKEASIEGQTCGFDFGVMEAVEGGFHLDLETDGQGQSSFRLPRQKNKELLLLVTDNRSVQHTIQLGDLISRTGFDWTAEDLEDLFISVSLTALQSGIRVEIWAAGEVYDFVS